MPHTPDHGQVKTFADYVATIRELAERLAALEADVAAIEILPLDDNGDAEVLVSVAKSLSLHIGLRVSPTAMLVTKHEDVFRIVEALKSEFNQILDHGVSLVARCNRRATAPVVGRHFADDLKRMEQDINEMIKTSGLQLAPLSDVPGPFAPPLRPRIVTSGD